MVVQNLDSVYTQEHTCQKKHILAYFTQWIFKLQVPEVKYVNSLTTLF